MRNEKYAIWPIFMAESLIFLHLIDGVGEQDGDVGFLIESRYLAVSRMRNKKYAIWPLVMAESPKLLHSSAMVL